LCAASGLKREGFRVKGRDFLLAAAIAVIVTPAAASSDVLPAVKRETLFAQPRPAAASQLAAPQPIFPRDSAKSVFDRDIFIVPSQGFSILLPEKPKSPMLEALPQPKPAGEEFAAAPQAAPAAPAMTPVERIIQEYGDPSEPTPVKAVDTAPKPYRAMLEALNAGDEQLAFRYAVKYVRYMRDLEKVTGQAVALEGQAMMREGLLPPGSWPSDPQYRQYHYLQNVEVGAAKDGSAGGDLKAYQSELDAGAREIIRRIKESEYDLFERPVRDGAAVADQLDEAAERRRARAMLTGRVPVDPLGKVDVYFFFRPYDREVRAMAADIERFYQSLKSDGRANFAALTIDHLSPVEVSAFRSEGRVTFPVIAGARLAEKFKVIKSPTTVFVAQSSGRIFVDPGLRSFYYLDELLRIMQGK